MGNPLKFNGRMFRRFFQEPEVKFLEELFRRGGGSPPADQTLAEVADSTAAIEQNQMQLLAEIKKLNHRISQLEDAQ